MIHISKGQPLNNRLLFTFNHMSMITDSGSVDKMCVCGTIFYSWYLYLYDECIDCLNYK